MSEVADDAAQLIDGGGAALNTENLGQLNLAAEGLDGASDGFRGRLQQQKYR